MSSGFGESKRASQPNSSGSPGNNFNNDASDFECNICFDLARDPVITLCGHLFCWPCLFKWLHHDTHTQECPVCKALVLEEKLFPLYGRGKSQTDPRTKPYPGVEIPRRPLGQRPETENPPPPSPPPPPRDDVPSSGIDTVLDYLDEMCRFMEQRFDSHNGIISELETYMHRSFDAHDVRLSELETMMQHIERKFSTICTSPNTYRTHCPINTSNSNPNPDPNA